ncbi:MAG: hypothetical protein R6W93_12885, partial [Candidatus Limnocylindrales bacterium]
MGRSVADFVAAELIDPLTAIRQRLLSPSSVRLVSPGPIVAPDPLAENERQQLVLAMVRSEASVTPFRLDRLASWPELWGWDNTDLAWEATWLAGPEARVLRFRDDWDAGPFITRLEGLGYERDEKRHGTVFTADFDPRSEPQAVLGPDERSIGWDQRVAISPDGRTVVFGWGESAYSTLRRAVSQRLSLTRRRTVTSWRTTASPTKRWPASP